MRLPRVVAAVLGLLLSAQAAGHEAHPIAHASYLEQAVAAQARHNFDRALELIEQSLAERSDDDAAWLQRMALHLIRGETDQAAESCAALRHASPLVMVTCHARVAHATGQSQVAGPRLERLLAATNLDALPAELRGWSCSVAGDLAQARGRLKDADAWYRRALFHDDNPQVRASLVDVLIDQNLWANAKKVLAEGATSLTLSVQKLIVARHFGEDIALQQRRLAHRFEHWIEEGDYEHAREMARFYLDVADDRARARRLARINATLQHEPEDRRLIERTR